MLLSSRVPVYCRLSTFCPACEDLLKRMLAKSPSKRPSIAEIYNSKWLSEISDPGSVPFPLALDEPDSAVGREQLSASLGSTSAFTAASYLSDRLRSSFASPSSPTLAAEMKVHLMSSWLWLNFRCLNWCTDLCVFSLALNIIFCIWRDLEAIPVR